jgi:FkbM family methyltransferase
MFTKEPGTIDWIDGFSGGDVLYDIGANVGIFTVYAAKSGKAAKVVSFEPESQNYAILNENIYLNGLQDRVLSLNIALSDRDSLDYLYLSEFSPGCSMHTFAESTDSMRRPRQSMFRQGLISFTLDSFIEKYNIDFPDHVKIDVDGLEHEIFNGAKATFGDSGLKSVLIELNEALESDLAIIGGMKDLGFRVTSRNRTEPGVEIYNYIFRK